MNSMLSLDVERLLILHVTDTHADLLQIHRLADYFSERRILVDLILHSGDVGDLSSPQTASKEQHFAAEGELTDTFASIENICCRLLYVPGNHDPESTFSRKPQLSSYSKNVHGSPMLLVPNLYLVSAGGSVDSFEIADKTKLKWAGYPYSEGKTEELRRCLEAQLEKVPADADVLVMTHCGPSGSPSVIWNGIVDMGSSDVLHFLQKLEGRRPHLNPLLAIHGHTHPSPGQFTLGSLSFPVSNAGSLVDGNFSVIHLAKHPETRRWSLERIEQLNLDAMY
eukprot:ANDGO_03833.mRNA.1 hypothetical protein CAOG_05811